MSIVEEAHGVTRRVSFDREEGKMRATRTVRESGNSVIVTIPPQILEGANFEVGDDVEISVDIESGDITVRRNDDPNDSAE